MKLKDIFNFKPVDENDRYFKEEIIPKFMFFDETRTIGKIEKFIRLVSSNISREKAKSQKLHNL